MPTRSFALQPFPGVELYYEDNFDAVTNMIVSITPSSKKEISEYGSPEQFLKKVSFLFGEQVLQHTRRERERERWLPSPRSESSVQW